MEIALALRHIWRHRIWLVPVTIVAAIGGLVASYHVSFAPPSIKSEGFEYGAASTQVLVDSSNSSLAELETPIGQIGERAALYAELLNTQPVRREIGRLAHVPWEEISVSGQDATPSEPNAEQRSSQILSAKEAVTLFFTVNKEQPIIGLSSQAPTADKARRIVSAAVPSLRKYVNLIESKRNVPGSRRVEFQQLGAPQAGTLASGSGKIIGLLVALFIFCVGCLLIVLVPRFLSDLRKAGAIEYRSSVLVGAPARRPLRPRRLKTVQAPPWIPPRGTVSTPVRRASHPWPTQ